MSTMAAAATTTKRAITMAKPGDPPLLRFPTSPGAASADELVSFSSSIRASSDVSEPARSWDADPEGRIEGEVVGTGPGVDGPAVVGCGVGLGEMEVPVVADVEEVERGNVGVVVGGGVVLVGVVERSGGIVGVGTTSGVVVGSAGWEGGPAEGPVAKRADAVEERVGRTVERTPVTVVQATEGVVSEGSALVATGGSCAPRGSTPQTMSPPTTANAAVATR